MSTFADRRAARHVDTHVERRYLRAGEDADTDVLIVHVDETETVAAVAATTIEVTDVRN